MSKYGLLLIPPRSLVSLLPPALTSRLPARRRAALVAVSLLATVVAVPALASDPATSDATAVDGSTVRVEWTGISPAGASPDGCDVDPTADTHEFTLAVPDGVTAKAQFLVEYEGGTDQKITVEGPDGTDTADDGGNNTGEFVTVDNAASGVYTISVCPFLADSSQDYTGRAVITAGDAGTATDAPTGGATNDGAVCPAPAAPVFEQSYIDTTRAGGEPIITTHPDGTLLWGSHAGTTHVFGPAAPSPNSAAFFMNYEGQTYQYFSADNGATWEFSPRTPISADAASGVPNTGFSDPEFAIDSAGNVFISEINLANISFSKSSDSGRTWTLQSIAEITASDRQWMEADGEDVLWFVANTFGGGSTSSGEPVTGSTDNRIYKSLDGGVTFSEGQILFGGQASSEVRVDKRDGAFYQLHFAGGMLEMIVVPDARTTSPPDLEFERYTIVEGMDRGSTIGPTFDMDDQGNLYVVWDDLGGGDFELGIYSSYSTDGGKTWAAPTRLDNGEGVAIWPWLAVGDQGNVAWTWLQLNGEAVADDLDDMNPLKGHPAEFAEGTWDVHVAMSQTGLGCATNDTPGFTEVTASTTPVHTGTICNGGTACQAAAIDRRLGDYFANTIAADGSVVIAVSDTMSGGATSLPLVIRQVGGPSMTGAPVPGPGSTPAPAPVTPSATPAPAGPSATPAPATPTTAGAPTSSGGGLPATGGGLAVLAMLALTGSAALRRRA